MPRGQRVIDFPLRRQRYTFSVTLEDADHQAPMYDGRSCHYALSAYWGAIFTMGFFECSGTVRIAITDGRSGSGGFYTKIPCGSAADLHIGYGMCEDWRERKWSVRSVRESLLSQVPENSFANAHGAGA